MSIVRNVRGFALGMKITWVHQSNLYKPTIDLSESQVIGQGQLIQADMIYVCFLVRKGLNLYIISADKDGARAIFIVERINQDYMPEDLQLVWERSNLHRRKNDEAANEASFQPMLA